MSTSRPVRFVVSNTDSGKCPAEDLPEYAFIGRSNVGKSTLINYLMGQKSLAKTSSRPGKTRTINHFLVADRWFLVDLPGYGYAQVSRQQRAQFGEMIESYLMTRFNLVCLFVLVDARHEPQKRDKAFLHWLGERRIPFALVFTKTDKLKRGAVQRNTARYKAELLEQWASLPDCFSTSAVAKTGGEAILKYIEALNQSYPGR